MSRISKSNKTTRIHQLCSLLEPITSHKVDQNIVDVGHPDPNFWDVQTAMTPTTTTAAISQSLGYRLYCHHCYHYVQFQVYFASSLSPLCAYKLLQKHSQYM